MWGGGGGGESWGGPGLFFLAKRGGPKREFHDDWGWVIVCFVKNHKLTTIHVEDLNKF